ncbi:helix-turn-helix transcriptional regulator [Actinoallomurus purpureus]|uniref:helix-turn-helix domain-containing protein n=1 Tax=Actinoallomurus purpureus TaxID=478114 RepID=UPI002092B760|nr:helix-turn-helix transcriptional regulator [Actinoallomurus purpureus]MCO6003973.1 helix-turn-helix transcriptional regulator [Actinoallomurus purpureus]
MPSRNIPSVRLRRIGSALRKAREDSGMTMDTACRRYGRSKGWLSTLENGLHSINCQELADLLDFYQVPEGPLRQSLLHLAAHRPGKSWERAYEGRISAAALDLASLEEDAELIRNFEPCVVPGLLQTPEYARALTRVGPARPVRNTGVLVAFRMARQKVLARPDPPHYVAVISESVLHHRVGGPDLMYAQLRRLSETAELENVALHVLPNSAAAYLWLAGPFHLLSLRPPGNLTVSVIEQLTKSLFVDDDKKIALNEEIFSLLLDASLDEDASLKLIERLASRV